MGNTPVNVQHTGTEREEGERGGEEGERGREEVERGGRGGGEEIRGYRLISIGDKRLRKIFSPLLPKKELTHQISSTAQCGGVYWAPLACVRRGRGTVLSSSCTIIQLQASLVVNDAHQFSAGQGPRSVNLLTALLYQATNDLPGTGRGVEERGMGSWVKTHMTVTRPTSEE